MSKNNGMKNPYFGHVFSSIFLKIYVSFSFVLNFLPLSIHPSSTNCQFYQIHVIALHSVSCQG